MQGHDPEDKLINVGEPGELHYWAEQFDVDPHTLVNAVKAAGVSANAVREYLENGTTPLLHAPAANADVARTGA